MLGAVAVSAIVVVFSIAGLRGWGVQPDNPSFLPRNYAFGLAVALLRRLWLVAGSWSLVTGCVGAEAPMKVDRSRGHARASGEVPAGRARIGRFTAAVARRPCTVLIVASHQVGGGSKSRATGCR